MDHRWYDLLGCLDAECAGDGGVCARGPTAYYAALRPEALMQAPQTTEQRSRAALVWGVDPVMGKAWLVDLYDASISPPLGIIADALSSNNTQSFQNGNTLYIILGLSAPPDEYPGKSRHEASEARARLRAALDGREHRGDYGPDDWAGDGPIG